MSIYVNAMQDLLNYFMF